MKLKLNDLLGGAVFLAVLAIGVYFGYQLSWHHGILERTIELPIWLPPSYTHGEQNLIGGWIAQKTPEVADLEAFKKVEAKTYEVITVPDDRLSMGSFYNETCSDGMIVYLAQRPNETVVRSDFCVPRFANKDFLGGSVYNNEGFRLDEPNSRLLVLTKWNFISAVLEFVGFAGLGLIFGVIAGVLTSSLADKPFSVGAKIQIQSPIKFVR